jgi:hypothetical protein
VSRLEQVIEQTEFLLERQTKAQKECDFIFSDLLVVIEDLLKKNKNDEQKKSLLEQMYDLVSGQAQKISDQAQEDIDFLGEQHKALQHIREVKNPQKANELLSMILEDDAELNDTEDFKREINEELSISKQNLQTVIGDIKDALQEGQIEETAMYLETIIADAEREEKASQCCCDFNSEDDEDGCSCDDCNCDDDDCDDDCDCDDDFEEEKKPKKNGKKISPACKGCDHNKRGIDIFAELSKYEKDGLEEEH